MRDWCVECVTVLLSAAACQPALPSDESALMLGIEATPPARQLGAMERIDVRLTDGDGNFTEKSFDVDAWPVRPARHTILIVVDTPDEGRRTIQIDVKASAGSREIAGSLAVSFAGGTELPEETIVLD
jgi:hypothetical protein